MDSKSPSHSVDEVMEALTVNSSGCGAEGVDTPTGSVVGRKRPTASDPALNLQHTVLALVRVRPDQCALAKGSAKA
ncbi:hypothetical protein PoB_005290500 [Plakobranchus ocellatus]|uniref:Uncharacterized protein n=1 Tax=Plakobranchus ocellatus TaxID=259542 RepID=A0AAV4C4Q3_9GAST|nr:hypothetical protein PoB_005290500 [Plakobranchus ocellatus]